MINVRDFGARGDGGTDDTPAIQTAIAAIPDRGGVIYFPEGMYKVFGTLDFSNKSSFVMRGEGFRAGHDEGSCIIGSINGDLVRYVNLGTGHTCTIEGMSLRNVHDQGTALHLENVSSGVVRQCQVSGNAYGIDARQGTFSLLVQSVKFQGFSNKGIGLVTGGHTVVQSCDITWWNEGIRACGVTVNIIGNRIECNKIGLNLGSRFDGATFILYSSLISGNSFEANDTAIHVRDVAFSTLSGMVLGGSQSGAPSGKSVTGMLVQSAQSSVFDSLGVGGYYSDVAIRINGWKNQRWRTVVALNNNAPSWDIQPGLQDIAFDGCNNV